MAFVVGQRSVAYVTIKALQSVVAGLLIKLNGPATNYPNILITELVTVAIFV